jgi:serine/threonine protein kinase
MTPGTRIGVYEIVALLGKGGMGEVYRAQDSRLGRNIAIKVSAAQFSERFDREVQAAAQLNRGLRQILVDYARRQRAAKRGEGGMMISLNDAQVASYPKSVDLLFLDDAFDKLGAVDGRKALAVDLKYFGGLDMAEIAAVQNISVKTVEKDVRRGAAWLRPL